MSFSRVRGHDHQIAGFRRGDEAGRLGHAYLLVGPEGVGKKLFATELAKAMLCHAGRAKFDACDACPSCARVATGSHPDLNVVTRPDDKHELPIDLMRELGRWMALAPAQARGKIAIVDEADTMSAGAANCFLKTLEEPPPGSLLLLVASDIEGLLPTTMSRCQVVRFGPLPEADLAAVLTGPPMSLAENVARQAARAADGSVAAACRLADPDIWRFRGEVIGQLAQGAPADPLELAGRIQDFAKRNSKQSADHRQQARLVIQFAATFFRDVVAYHAAGDAATLVFDEDRRLTAHLAGRVSSSGAVRLVRRTLEAGRQLGRYANLGFVLDGWLADVSALMDGSGTQHG